MNASATDAVRVGARRKTKGPVASPSALRSVRMSSPVVGYVQLPIAWSQEHDFDLPDSSMGLPSSTQPCLAESYFW
jgi:hypothetical protein